MAEALEGFLDEGALRTVPPAAVVAGVAGAAALATAAQPFPPDAYAGAPAGTAPPPPAPSSDPLEELEPEEPRRTSPWIWIAGVLGLVILVIVGLGLFRLFTADGPAVTPGPGTVALPSFVDQSFANASATAQQLEIVLEPTYVKNNDKAEGTIVSQDPPAGTRSTRARRSRSRWSPARSSCRFPS
jgi:hypothetical protein